jgi:N-acetyl-alpha-D-glucosaminyl L-malate synthase BshA
VKIAVVCHASVGGSGVVASELARGLVKRGHAVHVLATSRPGRPNGDNGYRFHPVEVPVYPVFEHAPYAMAVAGAVIELARSERLDVLHVHYAVPHAASALLVRQVLGAHAPKIVVTLHGTDVAPIGSHPSLLAVTAHAVAAADGITAPSQYLRHEAARRFGLAADRVELLPNFVDANRFTPPATRDPARLAALFDGAAGPTLFHVSNLRPVKRPVDLVETLARIRRQLPARLVVVGDGPERRAAEARADALGLTPAIRWLGARGDFASLLGHADGFLLTSESESFGLAALEALSAGVPVFAYRVGGLPEVVPETAGRLVPAGDLDALAAAVVTGIADPRLRLAARAHALHFTDDAAFARVETYLESLS